jgi:hypothetical protein
MRQREKANIGRALLRTGWKFTAMMAPQHYTLNNAYALGLTFAKMCYYKV